MWLRMLFASTLTLGALAGAVMTIAVIAAFWGGLIPAVLMIVLTVVVNFIGWAVSPFFTDLIQGWVYKLRKLSFEEFEDEFPEVGAFVRRTCEEKRIPLPRMRLVEDDNPTAYTYGSIPHNARVVGSRGLFRFLDIDEVCAVYAHELGHIKHLDFIVMTVARGWFRRSIHQFVDLSDMEVDGQQIGSWTRFWGICGGLVVGAIGLVSVVPWVGMMM